MNYPTNQQAKEHLIEVGRRLYESGLNTGIDGNFSCLVEEGTHIWTTTSGSAKGFLTERDLVKTNLNGVVVEGTGRPSSELKVHLCVYKYNPLAKAVIHVHSVAATTLACAGIGLEQAILPAVCLQLGKVHVTPYATPGTQEVADSMIPYIKESNGVLLGNHGPVTWGSDLWQAFTRMETLEQASKIMLQIEMLGKANYLTRDQEWELHQCGVRLGNFEK